MSELERVTHPISRATYSQWRQNSTETGFSTFGLKEFKTFVDNFRHREESALHREQWRIGEIAQDIRLGQQLLDVQARCGMITVNQHNRQRKKYVKELEALTRRKRNLDKIPCAVCDAKQGGTRE